MTEYGLAKVENAKQNGIWDKPDQPRPQFVMHEKFQEALDQHLKALEFFNSLNKPIGTSTFTGWQAPN